MLENYLIWPILKTNYVKAVMEKEELILKSVVLVKVKEWLSRCKCLDLECINNQLNHAQIVKDKDNQLIKKIFANNVKEKK